jgi:hypothetical protein
VSYALAAYALVIGAVLAYTGWLVRSAARLARELRARTTANRG